MVNTKRKLDKKKKKMLRGERVRKKENETVRYKKLNGLYYK